jgi:hypothetical protein
LVLLVLEVQLPQSTPSVLADLLPLSVLLVLVVQYLLQFLLL